MSLRESNANVPPSHPSSLSTTYKVFLAAAFILLFTTLLVSLVHLTRGVFTPYQKEPSKAYDQYSTKIESPLKNTSHYQSEEYKTSSELIDKLKEFGLWSVQKNSPIDPIVLRSFPLDVSSLSAQFKKNIFFNLLLPSALIVHSEIENEKKYLNQIVAKYDVEANKINFVPEVFENQQTLEKDEIEFIKYITKKYKTTHSETLLRRVDTIPVSLILAQGAIESSWGTSRFVKEANNLFGIWTWSDKGIIPLNRDEGKNHKVASYPSLIDSVRAYCLTLNRVGAYSEFRNIREDTKDPLRLAEQLYRYSERGPVYVDEVKNVIKFNNLQIYDSCYLSKKGTF